MIVFNMVNVLLQKLCGVGRSHEIQQRYIQEILWLIINKTHGIRNSYFRC